MTTYTRAAYVSQTRNLHGSVVCQAADALPFLLREGMTAHFVPPTLKGPRSASVSRIGTIREGAWEVEFGGVDSIDAAEHLVGCYCLVDDSCLSETNAADAPALLVGFTVEDDNFGTLGTVEDVVGTAFQSTLCVVPLPETTPTEATPTETTPIGQILVPYVEEFVKVVDEGHRVVRVSIPEALVTLNASGSGRPDCKRPPRGSADAGEESTGCESAPHPPSVQRSFSGGADV